MTIFAVSYSFFSSRTPSLHIWNCPRFFRLQPRKLTPCNLTNGRPSSGVPSRPRPPSACPPPSWARLVPWLPYLMPRSRSASGSCPRAHRPDPPAPWPAPVAPPQAPEPQAQRYLSAATAALCQKKTCWACGRRPTDGRVDLDDPERTWYCAPCWLCYYAGLRDAAN